MKAFLEFSCLFETSGIEIEGIQYNSSNVHELHNYEFPVHKYFDQSEDVVTIGRFIWENDSLYMRMWLAIYDLDFFYKEIIAGSLVPINVRLSPDTVIDENVKIYRDEFVEGYNYESTATV